MSLTLTCVIAFASVANLDTTTLVATLSVDANIRTSFRFLLIVTLNIRDRALVFQPGESCCDQSMPIKICHNTPWPQRD